jgi:hypothetical protein
LRHHAGLYELRLAVVVEKSLLERRPFVGKVSLLDRGVELDQLRALLDVHPAVEEIFGDHAAELRRDIDTLDGG